jgi:hypothetical protein
VSANALRVVGFGSAAGLAGIGLLHLAWARRSTFPFKSRAELNDAVVGRDVTPSPASCCAIAAALFGAAGLVARATVGDEPVVRAGAATVATVLGVRAGFGFAGRTDLLVPGSDSRRFRHLDRMGFSPLCLALGIGAAWAAFRSRAAP